MAQQSFASSDTITFHFGASTNFGPTILYAVILLNIAMAGYTLPGTTELVEESRRCAGKRTTAFQVLSVDASLLLAYALSFSREQEVNIFLLLREISDARPKATVFLSV